MSNIFSSNHVDLPKTEVELFQLNDYALLDTQNALNILGENQQLLESLLQKMYLSLPQDKLLLINAYAKKNWQEIADIAHRLKGGASYCGTRKLEISAKYLERYYKAGLNHLLDDLYRQFSNVLVATEQELKSHLDNKMRG